MESRQTREQLVAEFTELRNALVKRPPTSNTRLWNIYCDHLNDTDALAAAKTDAELVATIASIKARAS